MTIMLGLSLTTKAIRGKEEEKEEEEERKRRGRRRREYL